MPLLLLILNRRSDEKIMSTIKIESTTRLMMKSGSDALFGGGMKATSTGVKIAVKMSAIEVMKSQ